jgi:alkylmercury lyase
MKPSFELLSEAVIGLFPCLKETEERISLCLYHLLAKGKPVSTDLIAEATRVPMAVINQLLDSWYGVRRDLAGRVTGYWGLTITPTKHQLKIGDRTLFTWCAWDTLFLPQVLDAAVVVESECPVSGNPVCLEINSSGYREQAGAPIFISFVLPDQAEVEADVINSFCCHVNFLLGYVAADRWISRNPGAFLLTIKEAWRLGQNRNAARYPRTIGGEGSPKADRSFSVW